MSKDGVRSESMDAQHGVTGVDWKKGGGEDALVCVCIYIERTCLSQHATPLGEDAHQKHPG